MAFDYQTLKNIYGSNAIIDGQIDSNRLVSRTIATSNIQSGAVDGAKIGASQINYTSSIVTGTMPVSKGGTGLTGVGGSTSILRSNSGNSALEYASVGFQSMQVFTSGGTWNRPAGVRYVRVYVNGAGGGASGHGESGAAGGFSMRILDVTGISSVSVYVGGGGGGNYYSGAGGNGDYASFGPYASAGGGHGANRQNQHSGGVSGVGSGGDLNLHQGGGGAHHHSFGPGGTSFFGGPAPSGHPQGGHFSHNHQNHSAPGTGGTGGYFHGHRGSDGRPGIVVVEEFK